MFRIRIHFGSVFSSFLDPDPYSEYEFGSRRLKKNQDGIELELLLKMKKDSCQLPLTRIEFVLLKVKKSNFFVRKKFKVTFLDLDPYSDVGPDP